MTEELLTKEEIGKRLSIKPETILRLARQGIIPQVRVSHKIIRYDLQKVLEALREAKSDER